MDNRKDFRIELGKKVRETRDSRYMSQATLARLVGTGQSNISRIEAGLENVTIETIQKVCDVLGIGISFNDIRDR